MNRSSSNRRPRRGSDRSYYPPNPRDTNTYGQRSNRLTLDLDPDNEFIWNEDSLNKVNEKFNELIKERAGKDLDDYELRKIGSEIEGLIKFLLQNGQLSYNPDCRVMNYSMGLPKTNEVL